MATGFGKTAGEAWNLMEYVGAPYRMMNPSRLLAERPKEFSFCDSGGIVRKNGPFSPVLRLSWQRSWAGGSAVAKHRITLKSAICKRLFGSAVVIASLAVCAKAGATSYWDLDAYAGSAGYVDPTHSVTGIFDITGAGPGGGFTGSNSGGTEIVDSAIFEFTILDDQMKEPETESWQIDIGDEADLASGASKYLFNLVFSFGTASILADIQADGRVSYEVSSNGGDFYLLNAFMGVETVSSQQVPGSRVPDGGLTLALLGGAVLGMGTLFRRR